MELWCLVGLPYGGVVFGANWVILWYGLKLAVMVLGPLGMGSNAGPCQLLPVPSQPPHRSYKVICYW